MNTLTRKRTTRCPQVIRSLLNSVKYGQQINTRQINTNKDRNKYFIAKLAISEAFSHCRKTYLVVIRCH